MYLECMLLFAMSGSLHLTSVWLCMSVVFVVTLQWPIGTNIGTKKSLKHLFVQSVNRQLSALWNDEMNC